MNYRQGKKYYGKWYNDSEPIKQHTFTGLDKEEMINVILHWFGLRSGVVKSPSKPFPGIETCHSFYLEEIPRGN